MRIATAKRTSGLGFNMTPMIDVVFLLIIFFLVSSRLVKQEAQMPLPLPTATTAEEAPTDAAQRVIINVRDDGVLLIAGREMPRNQLERRLQEERTRAGKAELEIRIRCDRHVAYEYVEPILLACARAGVWNVSFAVIRPEDRRE